MGLSVTHPYQVVVNAPAVSISADNPSVTEGNPATFTVTVTTAPDSALTVNVSVTDSGRFLGGPPPTTVVIPMGDTTARLTVPTVDDRMNEPNGTIIATVTTGSGYMVAAPPGNSAAVTVMDDDVGDTRAPTFVSATVNGNTLVLTYDEALDTTSVPAGDDFTIGVVSSVSVNTVAISGVTVTLTLSAAVASTDVVTVTYRVPGTNPLRDVAGNNAVASTDAFVTNNTLAPTLPSVSISVVNASVTEGGDVTFMVTVTRVLASNLTVNVSVTDSGSFISGTAPTTVMIPMGATTATLTVSTVDDGTDELDGTITATVATGMGYTVAVAPGNSAMVTVTDNDGPALPTVSISAGGTVTEGDDATFTVEASSTAPAGGLTVNVNVADSGTFASSGETGTQMVTIPMGMTTAMLDVSTVNDSTDEVDGTITVTVETGSGYTVALAPNNSASVTVTDNDGPALPTVSISAGGAVAEGEAVTFTVAADVAPTSDLTVNVSVSDSGSFISGTAPTMVTITSGSTSATLTVNTDDDSVDEVNGIITVTVTTGMGYTVAVSPDNSAEVTVNDNDGVDVVPPTLDTAAVNGDTLTLTYDEALDEDSVPAVSAFTVREGGTPATVSTVAVSGMTVTLTLSASVAVGFMSPVTVSYTKPGTNPVQDVAGNEADSFTDEPVADNTPPTLSLLLGDRSHILYGNVLSLLYNEVLDAGSVPDPSAFTLGGTSATVIAVAINSVRVELTLFPAVTYEESRHSGGRVTPVTVSYTPPGTNPLQDEAGNDAAAFTDLSVRNQTTPAPTGVTASSPDPGELVVSWTEPEPGLVNRYEVQYRIDGGTNWEPATPDEVSWVTAGGTLTHTFTGLATGMYHARARSRRRDTYSGNIYSLIASGWVETGSAVTVTADTTPPTLDTVVVNGSTLTLTYDEALDAGSVPAEDAFTLGSTSASVDTVVVSGMTVTLTLSAAVSSGDAVTVTYTVPTMNPLQDATGNDAAALTTQAVTNNTPDTDTTAPVFVSAAFNGNMLTLTYDEALDTDSVPAASAFTLGNTRATVSTVAVSGMTVTLTLSAAVEGSLMHAVQVSYAVPSMNPVQDLAGNEARFLNNAHAADNTPPILRFTSLYVYGSNLRLPYHDSLDASSVPDPSAFTVRVGDTSATVIAVRITFGRGAGRVNLTFFPAVTFGETVTVTYRVPSMNPVKDTAGNNAAAFTDLSVPNWTPPAPTGVMASSSDPGELVVSWTEPSDHGGDEFARVGHYEVQYRIDGGMNWEPATPVRVDEDTAGAPITHTFTGLAAGMYHARVLSRGSSGFRPLSAWVETGSAVQVDVRTVRIDSDIRTERNSSLLLGCNDFNDPCTVFNLEARFRGALDTTSGLRFRLTDAPDHGHVSDGLLSPLSVGGTILWSDAQIGNWTYEHHDSTRNNLSSPPPLGADVDALTDSFEFEFEGTIYRVDITINQPPEVVAAPSEPGSFTVGTEATFDVADDFTDPNGDTLTYELGAVAGPVTTAVDISDSTVTIDATATAGEYTIPVVAMESPDDGALSVTHEYVVVVSGLAPTGVTATADAAGELAVSWTAPDPAPSGGYHVQYSNDGGANWLPDPEQAVAADTDPLMHTFTGLAAGTYSTRVRAVYSSSDTSAWVQGTAVQVDVYELITDVEVERGGIVDFGCQPDGYTYPNCNNPERIVRIDVWFRGAPVIPSIAENLDITLVSVPEHGAIYSEGSVHGPGVLTGRGLSVFRNGDDGHEYRHRASDTPSDADPNATTDSFDIEVAGVRYTVPVTIFNRAPQIVDTPSAGPFTEGTEATFDVASHFTDSPRDSNTLTYDLGTVTGPVPTAVTFMGSTVTIGTTATAGTYSIPVTASDGLLDTTYTYTVVVNPEPESNNAPTVDSNPSEPGPFPAGTEATFDVAADFDDSDTSDTLSYALGTVTGPVPTAVTLAGSTVTIDTTATAGTYSIPVVATDDGTPNLSVTHVYQVVVEAVNRMPVVVAEPSVPGPFLAGVEGTFDVSDDFSDPDGDSLTYSLGTVDSAAAVTLMDSTVTVGTGATAGTYTVPVTAEDGDGLMVTHTYSVEVLATPEVSIRAVTASVAEGTLVTFQVVAEPPPGSALTVMLDVDDGAGDFIAGTAPAQVEVGTGGTGTFTVPTVNDRVGEADGRITATITTDSAYTVGMPSSATVTVTDDDDPEVSITAGASVTEGGDAIFTVTASKAPATSLIVNVSVDDGAGDFISGPAPQMVTIPANTTSAMLMVSTEDDSMNEADGRITAALAPGTGYTVATPPAHRAMVAVSDDDTPEVSITAVTSPVTEGVEAQFIVSASTASAGALTVNVSVDEGSSDFISGTAPRTVTINAGQMSTLLRVATEDDSTDEPGGTLAVEVTASADYTVAAAPGNRAMVVVNDNDGTADPTVTIAAANASVREAPNRVAAFTVTASPPPSSALMVNVSVTESGSFISGTAPTEVEVGTGGTGTLRVDIEDDSIDELDGTVTATVTSGTGYMVGASSSATVTVTDDDDPVVRIAAGASPVGEGTSALFEVSASTVQASDLVVNVNVTGTAGLILAGEIGVQMVTIPSGESSVTLSVPTEDDRVDEAEGIIGVRVETGAGYRVARLVDSRASVTVTDDDEAGITVTPTSGLTTTEAGGTATFTVVLDSEPTADVSIGVSSSDTGEGTVSTDMLTFTDGNWDDPQTVAVTGVDDSDDDGTVDYTIMLAAATSTDPNYGGVSGVGAVDPADVSVSNEDDDGGIEPTVTITAGGGVTEGADATFTVAASPAPTSDLTVNVDVVDSGTFTSSSETGARMVTINSGMMSATLTVSTEADSIDEMDGTITATLTPDTGYRVGMPSSAQVAVTDNDTAGITVMPTSGLTTTEGGDTATFTVVLDSEPTASVSIGVSSSDTTEGTVSTTTLMFTSTTWDAAQTVTVTGVDDSVDDGDQTYTIELAAAVSTDPNYSGVDPTDVGASNTDDDVAGITVAPTTGLTTTEAGGMATFTVVLDSEPTSSVSIGVSSSDTTEGTVSPTTLMFTDSTWNQPQTVTVTGVNDPMTDDDQTYMILLAAAVSTDPNYSGEDPDDVSVTNTDDDGPGITVTPTSGLTTTEAGGTATFTVVLNTQPTADVSIGVSSSDTGEGMVSSTSLTFMNTTWNNAQTVTVTGVDDTVFDGPQMYTIELAAAESTDTNYDDLDPTDVSVSNTDNDAAPTSITLTVQPSTLGEGDSATDVTVTATFVGSTVSAATTVTLSLGGGAVNGTDYNATAPIITIAAETATATATFAITPIDDSDGEGDETIEIGGTATGGFSGTVNPVTVTLTDNDADVTAPTLSTAVVNGNMLVLTYSETLDATSTPAATAFTLGGTSATVSTVAISGAMVTLTLSAAVTSTDVVTVTYTVPTAPGANPLRDAAGNNAAGFIAVSVDNETAPMPAPMPTNVMASSPAPGELEVSWTEPPGAPLAFYEVQYRSDSDTNWEPATPEREAVGPAGNLVMHTFTGLAAGMYRARVRSVGDGNDSAWVETASAVQVNEALAFSPPAQTDLVYTVNVAIDPPVTLPPATGGTGTISYTLTGPNGADLSEVPGLTFTATNRELSGTPTTAGTTELTYTATDSATPTPATVTQTFTITVNTVLTLPTQDNLAYTVNTAIDTLELPAATGGVGTITYALTGTLPAGLAFDTGTRVLSGTPNTAGGPTTLTYTATDMDTPAVTVTQTFTITVSTGLALPTQDNLVYTANTLIDPVTLPQAMGGTGAISYALTGALPAGLAFNAGTRVLSGTPTMMGGPTTLTYTATDSAITPTVATQMFTITINAALALDLTTLTVPDYGAGTAIAPLTLPAATGGTTPISYTLTGPSAGPLPTGLTFNETTRVLSGTPSAVGTTTLTYTATDAATTPVEVMDTFDVTVLPVVTITQGTSPVTEGTAATFTVTATPAPAAALTVNVNVTQSGMFIMGTAPTSLTVGTSGSGTLTVPTEGDTTDEVDGSITATLMMGTGYIVGSLSSATVTVNDNDGMALPAIGISAAPATVTEGTAATFMVTASTAPASDLTVMVSVTQTGMFIMGTAPTMVEIPAGMISATLMVPTVDDATGEMSGSIQVTVTGGTGYIVGTPDRAVVTVEDNDVAGVTVTPTSLRTTEAAGTSRTATFTVVLNTPTTAHVVIGVSSSDMGEGTVSPDTLFFATSEWDQAQTVTVTGVDDDEADGDQTYTIMLPVSSADLNYDGISPVNVRVTNEDDDTAGFTVAPTTGLTTTEAGGTATFTVVLDSQPTVDVVIGVSSSDTGEGTVSPDTLFFATSEWDQAQTVTVTGVNDDVDDGEQMYIIELAAAVSTDPNYSGVDPDDVSVSNTDNDAAPTSITLTVQPNSLSEGDSATDVTVTATLDGGTTVSTATTVTLSLGGSAVSGTDYSATAPTITIAAETATGTATFAIMPTDDGVVEGAENIVVSGTAMGGFTGTVNLATVTLTDNDVADATPPTLSTATVNGNTLVLTYDEVLDAGSVPAASAFTLGGAVASVNTVSISGVWVTLSLSAAVFSTDVVTVTYAVPSSNPLQDVAGNDAAHLTDEPVTNNTPAPPAVSISAVNASVSEGNGCDLHGDGEYGTVEGLGGERECERQRQLYQRRSADDGDNPHGRYQRHADGGDGG